MGVTKNNILQRKLIFYTADDGTSVKKNNNNKRKVNKKFYKMASSGLPLDYPSILRFRHNLRHRTGFEEDIDKNKPLRPKGFPAEGLGLQASPRWFKLTDMYEEEKREAARIVEKYKAAVEAQEALDAEKREKFSQLISTRKDKVQDLRRGTKHQSMMPKDLGVGKKVTVGKKNMTTTGSQPSTPLMDSTTGPRRASVKVTHLPSIATPRMPAL